MRNDSGPVPIIIAASAILCLSLMDSVIKGLSPHYPTLTIVFMRFVSGGVVALAVYLAAGAPKLGRETLLMGAVRSVFAIATAGLFFTALGLLPLAEAVALAFLTPVMIALFGRVFLGERIAAAVLIGIALSAVGMFVMLADQLLAVRSEPRSILGIAAALLSTIANAASQILTRARANKDPISGIVLLQTWMPATMLAPFALPAFHLPATSHLTAFIAVGFLGTTGHLLLTWAFSRANAARIGVVQYTSFAWAALIGFVWFAEMPTATTWLGTAFILAGAFVVARRNGKRGVAPAPMAGE